MSDHVYDIFGNPIDICIIKFIKTTNISDLLAMNASERSMIYFRIFYYFYAICKYTHEFEYNVNKDKLKQIFFEYYDLCAKKTVDYTEIIEHIRKTINERFDYLYNVFFVQDNVYFNTYFNNLIKYFLPLPYELLKYGIVITYRNTKQICRNDNIDYLEVINKTDFIKQRTYVKSKNIDAIKNELNFHIPIKYFSKNNFNDEHLYLVACKSGHKKYLLVIAKRLSYINESWNCELMYTRDYDGIDEKLMREGMSFEILFKKWKKDTRKMTLRNVFYINVLKTIKDEDLFNVFPRINLPFEKLYHNTGLEMTHSIANEKLEYPTFFYPNMSGYSEYFKNRKCIIYNVIKPMNHILDTTRSIITFNDLINDRKTQSMPCAMNKNKDNISLDQYIKHRPECDVQDQCHYTGRRKLQEILFKTRKYDASKIWIYEFRQEDAMKVLSISENELYNNIYHYPLKNEVGIKISDYDSVILRDIDVNGFFSTDYHRVWDKGGEVLLTNPKKFLSIDKFLDKMCFEISDRDQYQDNKKNDLARQTNIKMNRPCDDMENAPDSEISFPLSYSDDLNTEVNSNIRNMIIGNKYRIIGSYNKKKLITDVDITNFFNTDNVSLITTKIQKLIKNLPDKIVFVYMTLGTKYEMDQLITIDWELSSKDKVVIKTINREKINQMEIDLFGSNGKINQLIQNDVFQGYMFLRNNTKIKWSQKDIMNGFTTHGNTRYELIDMLKLHVNSGPIMHFIMDYNETFIIFDVAIKYAETKQKYSSSGYLTYYNHEWFYILEDLSRSPNVSDNIKHKIIELLDQYNGIKQILMQLYYLEYIVLNGLINDSKFIKYCSYLIYGVTKIFNNNYPPVNILKECVNSVKMKKTEVKDPKIWESVSAFNSGLFADVNTKLEVHAVKFMSMINEKPKYYHLI